jgi:dimethylargininase
MSFSRAWVRTPGANFAHGLTSAADGPPDLDRALRQHARYCEALRECGLTVTELPAQTRYPDGTFVEDTAIITQTVVIATRPGAATRLGEVAAIESTLRSIGRDLCRIEAPGTLDGGDVCDADGHFFIGVSARTNEEGARQLAQILERHGYRSTLVDIRRSHALLHLKSGMAYLGARQLVIGPGVPEIAELAGYERICVESAEAYAANCVRINARVLVAAGYPNFSSTLRAVGHSLLVLDMSEFRKMDGGLSCLSLRI